MKNEQENSAVASYYDELDEFYREAWGERLHHGLWLSGRESLGEALDNLEELIFNRAEIRPTDRIVDIGSGYGGLARKISQRFNPESVTGVTNSLRQFQRALDSEKQDSSSRCARFIHADWLNSGLPESEYEVAISVECFSHVADKSGFLREAARVLRPGARLVIACWSAPRAAPSWARTLILEPIQKSGRLNGILSVNEIEQLLAENGFTEIEALDLSREAAPTWTKMALRLTKLALTQRKFAGELLKNPIRTADLAITTAKLILAFRLGWIGYEIWKAKF
ncbi:MAG: tocopherol O-methyltransferase [Verrucomicrobiales bacterium]